MLAFHIFENRRQTQLYFLIPWSIKFFLLIIKGLGFLGIKRKKLGNKKMYLGLERSI